MRRIDRIHAAIESWPEQPFAVGKSDCCYFVNHVYFRVDQRNYLPYPYRSKQEADFLLREFGTFSDAVSFAVGRCHVETQWLREGDLALYRRDGFEGLGIVVSCTDIATIRQSDGKIMLLALDEVVHGWRLDAETPAA